MAGTLISLLGGVPFLATTEVSASVIERNQSAIIFSFQEPCPGLGYVLRNADPEFVNDVERHLPRPAFTCPKQGEPTYAPGAHQCQDSPDEEQHVAEERSFSF